MNATTNITELHHFLDMINQLAKFTPQCQKPPNLYENYRVQKIIGYIWSDSQQQAFEAVRNMVSSDSIATCSF